MYVSIRNKYLNNISSNIQHFTKRSKNKNKTFKTLY